MTDKTEPQYIHWAATLLNNNKPAASYITVNITVRVNYEHVMKGGKHQR